MTSESNKVDTLYDIFPNATKDQIVKILQYYDDDEIRAMDALIRDGGSEALSNRAESGSLKEKRNKKKKKSRKETELASSATASFDADDSSSLHSSGNVDANLEKECLLTGNRNEKNIVSCAIQSGVSVTDTESLKGKNLSFLDLKDVTLLTEGMKKLLIKDGDHDVKIVVKDKEFRAHRIILRTRSPVFAMMLSHDSEESNTGIITIKDCDPDSFDEFLLYVYSGKTENLTPSKALHLYYTADKYDLPALKERCAILLKWSLSVESICDVIRVAAKHGEKQLLKAATEFFARNVREILVTVGWQEFLAENPVVGNELYIKSLDILFSRK